MISLKISLNFRLAIDQLNRYIAHDRIRIMIMSMKLQQLIWKKISFDYCESKKQAS